jgi:hypothetical protein
MNSIEKTIEKLKSSPLFYLFLSSRELFHTNFWFWLSTINETETIKLFSSSTIKNNLKFKREHNQSSGEFKSKVDLYITNSENKNIVIENKVKDFPTYDQLERIKKSFGESDTELILATLFWSKEISFQGWKVVTYREISEAINPSKFTSNQYYLDLIADYKDFTLSLAYLSEQLDISDVYNFAISANKELYALLNDIKLWEGYQKLRASHLLLRFNKFNQYNAVASYSINNQKATIDFLLEITNDYKIGISIEDNQYRKFVTGPKHVQFSENLRANEIFFSSSWMSARKNKMMSYAPNYKYQYEKIGVMNFDDLFKKVNKDILIMLESKEEIKKQIPS